MLGLRDEMTKEEIATEAHFAFKRKLITKRQRKVLTEMTEKVKRHD